MGVSICYVFARVSVVEDNLADALKSGRTTGVLYQGIKKARWEESEVRVGLETTGKTGKVS